ncbi:MAG: recombinase RecQ [Bacteroidetes bacterium]|nr:MAG: recombinase RecQ [Bacteroidota bacterium]
MLPDFGHILKQHWGYEDFRPLQEEVIRSVYEKKDCLALMPTGGGKSLTFQIPTLAMEGICIVVTPLIALMKDQVDQLRARNIKALSIHSGMSRNEILVTLDNAVFGDFKFLYVSPERLSTPLFRSRVQDMKVCLVAVDEAHCISQWGYDFRPAYLEISRLRELLPEVPILALTATATSEVCKDIMERLDFDQPRLLKQSFDRANLAYRVMYSEDKGQDLLEILRSHEGAGIVYTRSRKKCRDIALWLREQGVTAGYYHAGLKPLTRDERQQAWIEGRYRIMVATNAFGMGIDKANVRLVIHVDLPDNPESYFQEAGRAGRDGEPSWAFLLYSAADEGRALQRLETNFPELKKVRELYSALGNFLQIPIGSGKGQSYDFEFGDFLARYRVSAMLAHASLELLQREGYITITEAFMNPSRVMFIIGRDELYHFQVKHAGLDGLIKLMLRTYSGFFTQYVRIDEALLARRAGSSPEKIRDYLKQLAKHRVIHYIPRKNVPVVSFLEERLDEKNLLISPGRYLFRKERYEKRLREILRYATSTGFCRNQFLLSYFGQMDSPRCGRCDVCTEAKAKLPGKADENTLREVVLSRLGQGPLDLQALTQASMAGRDELNRVLEAMLAEGLIGRDQQLRLYLKGR